MINNRFQLAAAILLTFPVTLLAYPPRLAPGTAEAMLTQPAAPLPDFKEDADLIAAITPAVVSVFPARIVEESGENPLDQFFNRDRSTPGGQGSDGASRDNERVQGVGSGVVLSPDGWIVTNSHVVHFQNGKLADAISVEFPDRKRFDAVIVGADPLTDLALLKIQAEGLTFMPLGASHHVKVGHPVWAVGNPFKLGTTATKGMVSALRRSNLGITGENGFESFIQTDAAINPGNSGGALSDRYGRLVGINTAIWGGAGGNVGIGFAVPSNLVKNIVAQLAETGKVERGFFGWQIAEPNRHDIEAAGLTSMAGAKLAQVMADGPAAQAGLKAGDIVLEAAGETIFTRGDLRFSASMVRPGQPLPLVWQSGKERKTGTLTAGRNNEKPTAPGVVFRLEALPGVDFTQSRTGLAVGKIERKEVTKAGLETGMEITEINGSPITNASEAEAALGNGVNRIKARKGQDEQTLALRLPLGAKPE